VASEAVRGFLEQGQSSGLLSAAACDDLVARNAVSTEEVARLMVETQVLTPYQADLLLAGRGQECMVASRYRILDKLGAGGMGTVYKAQDTRLDRLVAIKMLAAHTVHDAAAVARFQREAKALAKVSHAAIVGAYDAGEDRGQPFLVMEYSEGASLARLLETQGRIPATLAADYIYQAALGLEHAHEKGLVHRDLKPSNLLLTPEGQIKILDHGRRHRDGHARLHGPRAIPRRAACRPARRYLLARLHAVPPANRAVAVPRVIAGRKGPRA
jgi:eukaryotic-like serine/threonine-protein kinase